MAGLSSKGPAKTMARQLECDRQICELPLGDLRRAAPGSACMAGGILPPWTLMSLGVPWLDQIHGLESVPTTPLRPSSLVGVWPIADPRVGRAPPAITALGRIEEDDLGARTVIASFPFFEGSHGV